MGDENLPLPSTEPMYISYLLDQKQKHDCYFLVGRKNLVEPVKIGVVKKMLMAYSEVMRAELEESMLAEKGVIHVEDLYPDTFINLLKYVYGYDITGSLSFEEAGNLLYAAEKYMIAPLKTSLSARLTDLLTPENICSLLNNPACYTTLELQSAINEILQCETDKVLDSPNFLNLHLDGFSKILEQEAMNVQRIQVWRAAVKWAKHKSGSEESEVFSKVLSKALSLFRFYSIKRS